MNINLIEALEQLEEEKGIKKDEVIEALERALQVSYKKAFKDEEHVEVLCR
jgi:N utilization substance protein A